MKSTIFTGVTLVLLTAASQGVVTWKITEVYAGISGPDGTADWFEVANLGSSVGDTGGLVFDDNSADPTIGGSLTSFTLSPGQSAVFLVNGAASDIADFELVWGSGINVGTTAGGGALGGTDAVYLFDSNLATASVVDFVTFQGIADSETFAGSASYGTLDVLNNAISQLNLGGAFLSNPFFNDNLGATTPGNNITLTGSPGAIPEPTTGLLGAFGLLALLLRRR